MKALIYYNLKDCYVGDVRKATAQEKDEIVNGNYMPWYVKSCLANDNVVENSVSLKPLWEFVGGTMNGFIKTIVGDREPDCYEMLNSAGIYYITDEQAADLIKRNTTAPIEQKMAKVKAVLDEYEGEALMTEAERKVNYDKCKSFTEGDDKENPYSRRYVMTTEVDQSYQKKYNELKAQLNR